ncbi:MAG: biopolymer transporter ExbD [Solimonas sp.]
MSLLGAATRRRRLLKKAARPDAVPLNLVSMIDIFTTLVFFLMLTSTSVQTLRSPRSLQLPPSTSVQQPADMAVVTVTHDAILFQGQSVMSTADAQRDSAEVLAPLKARLLDVPQSTGADGKLTRGEINIMADKDLPFGLLHKVMATCGGDAGFARISLAVTRGASGGSP